MKSAGISRARHGRIGIVTGSGPEAGIDLWQKVLACNRDRLGADYAGDVSAPYVVVFSVPLLGLSMDLERHEDVVWQALRQTVAALDKHVDCYAIACNTLNYFEPRLRQLEGRARLISVGDVVGDFMRDEGLDVAALLGARPALDMAGYSPYRAVAESVSFELPGDVEELHTLITDIKLSGGHRDDLGARFERVLGRLTAETALLACTELPLISVDVERPHLVDVTHLLARALVDAAHGSDWQGAAGA